MQVSRSGMGRGTPCQKWIHRCLSSSAPATAPQRSSVLRPYQDNVIERAVDLYGQGTRRLLVPLATGLGKTVIFTHLPQAFPELCRRGIVVLVHRNELVQQVKSALGEPTICFPQAAASFSKFLPHFSIGVEKGAEKAHPGLDVVVASVQTLGRRGSGAARLRQYASYGGVIIVDEAHHVKMGGMYDTVLNAFGVGSECKGDTRDGRLLAGFTATPQRADGLSLRPFFDFSIGERDLSWGIASGYLVDIHAYAVKTATDIGAVPVRMQEFSTGALSAAVNNDLRNAAAARAMLDYGAEASATGNGTRNPRGIAFCADVAHAHSLARVLNEHGITALAVDGKMKKEKRARVLDAFRSGEVSTLTNCGVLTEGFDAPFCDTIVMCRPTKSNPLYMQMLGRGTRPWLPSTPQGSVGGALPPTAKERRRFIRESPKPRMHVIDLVDNCGMHEVMNISAALGLSSDFRSDAAGEAFSVERVASLAAEARMLMGEESLREGEESPLRRAKNPRDLSLLVKRYRLIEGKKTAQSLVSMPTSMPQKDEDWDGGKPIQPFGDIAISNLSVGERLSKDTFLRVTVEAIITPDDEASEDDFEAEDDDGLYDGDCDDEVEDDSSTGPKKAARSFGRRREKSGPRRRRQSMSAITVHLRHQSSKVLFVWRTAGVKDTCGTELHEGEAYRLVGTVQSVADVAAGKVGVTRCRLTPITDARGGIV